MSQSVVVALRTAAEPEVAAGEGDADESVLICAEATSGAINNSDGIKDRRNRFMD